MKWALRFLSPEKEETVRKKLKITPSSFWWARKKGFNYSLFLPCNNKKHSWHLCCAVAWSGPLWKTDRWTDPILAEIPMPMLPHLATYVSSAAWDLPSLSNQLSSFSSSPAYQQQPSASFLVQFQFLTFHEVLSVWKNSYLVVFPDPHRSPI